jgi:hypothetical protein
MSSWRGCPKTHGDRSDRPSAFSQTNVTDPNLDRALEAMTAPELRSFVRGVLDGMEHDQRPLS